MVLSSIITDLRSNSVSFNKKISVNDNLVKDVKPDKRLKGNKSNVNNDDGKDQSLHNIPNRCMFLLKSQLLLINL